MVMKSRDKKGKDSEGRPSRFGFLLGLAALLFYFFLPLFFYGHLTNFSPAAVSGAAKTTSSAIEGRTQEPGLPHDSNSCPICRAASHFQDYELSLSFQAPDGSALVGPLSERYGSSGLDRADGLTPLTRAPPVMPLSSTTA